MMFAEVKPMENEEKMEVPQEEYTPRPKWQVWGARVGVVLLAALVILYYITIARGGF